MKIYDMPQGSPEWFRVRAGAPTASRFSDIITAKTGALSKSSTGYAHELIGECFCPEFEYFKGNMHTRRGHVLEPDARELFMTETGLDVKEVGFVASEDGISGCSPDGLILGDGDAGWIAGLEIKCPTPKVHVEYHAAGELPDAYRQQVHGSMVVTGLNVWHFMSYCEGMAPLYLVVERDGYTRKLQEALSEFEADYQKMRDRLIGKLQGQGELI